jgi:hypothetical protein
MVINSSKFDFREVVQKYLEEQRYEVIEAMSEAIDEVAKESVKKLKATSPRGKGQTHQYYKGWAYKIEKGRLSHGATVYGKTGTYQLAHLLEKGHAKRGGGRTNEYVHIKPVEEWAIDEVIDRTITKVERLTR